jgi:membrane protease YdiL (CAAX protease family)
MRCAKGRLVFAVTALASSHAPTALPWPPEPLGPALLPLCGAAFYVAYHLVGLRLTVWQRRLWGAFILGLVPALGVAFALDRTPAELGLATGALGLGLGVAAAFAAVLLPLTAFAVHGDSARARALRTRYPEARPPRWNARAYTINAATWAAYLFGYELFFRGVLLFPLAEAIGAWPAITTLAFAYIAVHLERHPGELLGTFVSGVGFGALALATGSIVGPWIAHTLVAVGNDLASTRAALRAAARAT